MNKNTKSKSSRAAKAFGRVKHGRAGSDDVLLAATVGHKARHSKHAKVAWQGGVAGKRQD